MMDVFSQFDRRIFSVRGSPFPLCVVILGRREFHYSAKCSKDSGMAVRTAHHNWTLSPRATATLAQCSGMDSFQAGCRRFESGLPLHSLMPV